MKAVRLSRDDLKSRGFVPDGAGGFARPQDFDNGGVESGHALNRGGVSARPDDLGAAHGNKIDPLAGTSDRPVVEPATDFAFPQPPSARDWPEDFGHENGKYFNHCSKCSSVFTGHKRRALCKVCASTDRKPRPAIRIPKRRVPNRTENLYQGEARRRWPDCELRYEAFAFILPSGCRYVPDWTAWRGAELVAVVEVKGGYLHPNSTRSIHAWKEASAAWPAVRFVFAQWKDGTWNETEITPIKEAMR